MTKLRAASKQRTSRLKIFAPAVMTYVLTDGMNRTCGSLEEHARARRPLERQLLSLAALTCGCVEGIGGGGDQAAIGLLLHVLGVDRLISQREIYDRHLARTTDAKT